MAKEQLFTENDTYSKLKIALEVLTRNLDYMCYDINDLIGLHNIRYNADSHLIHQLYLNLRNGNEYVSLLQSARVKIKLYSARGAFSRYRDDCREFIRRFEKYISNNGSSFDSLFSVCQRELRSNSDKLAIDNLSEERALASLIAASLGSYSHRVDGGDPDDFSSLYHRSNLVAQYRDCVNSFLIVSKTVSSSQYPICQCLASGPAVLSDMALLLVIVGLITIDFIGGISNIRGMEFMLDGLVDYLWYCSIFNKQLFELVEGRW